MKDLLHPISLVVATLGFLCLVRDVPTRRRDPASAALAAVFLLSGLSFLFSITPMWNYLDRVLGTVNLSVPLAQGCVVALLAATTACAPYGWRSTAKHPRSSCRSTASTRPRGVASAASRSGSTAEQSRSGTAGL